MSTLDKIKAAGDGINRYQKVHGRDTKTDQALDHLRHAYALVRANGGK